MAALPTAGSSCSKTSCLVIPASVDVAGLKPAGVLGLDTASGAACFDTGGDDSDAADAAGVHGVFAGGGGGSFKSPAVSGVAAGNTTRVDKDGGLVSLLGS